MAPTTDNNSTMKQAAIFLDRDDTLIDDPGYLADPNLVRLLPNAAEAIRQFNEAGYRVVIVTNQSGIARGLLTEVQLEDIHAQLELLLEAEGAHIDGIYYCPYLDGPEAIVPKYRRKSHLRKPAPGMLEKAANELNLDLDYSWMIGDSPSDVEAGKAAGCQTIIVNDNGVAAGTAADHKAASLVEAARIVIDGPSEVPTPEDTVMDTQVDGDDMADPEGANAVDDDTGIDDDHSASINLPDLGSQSLPTDVDDYTEEEEPAQTTLPPMPLVDTRSTEERVLGTLEDIRNLMHNQRRDTAQSDFSLGRLGATLFQFLAAGILLWGVVALLNAEEDIAIARLVLAGVLQLVTLTLFVLDRSR